MKRFFITLALLFSLQYVASAQYGGASITFQNFYDELSPYGDWVNSPEYGYVWAPNVGRGFQPYSTNGYWANTNYGWTWVSSYRWGWAPFHYGRWVYDEWRGWLWIPGYEWGPGWVTWGNYGNDYGWAPLGPNINISINFGWRPPSFWWTFVPGRYFGTGGWYNYRVNRPTYINNVTIINNIYNGNPNSRPGPSNGNQAPSRAPRGSNWFTGPNVSDIERQTGSRVRTLPVNDVNNPRQDRVNNNGINMYRPSVSQSTGNAPARPSRVQNIDRIRPATTLPNTDPSPTIDRTRPTVPSVPNNGNNSRPTPVTPGATAPARPSRPSETVNPSTPSRPSQPSTNPGARPSQPSSPAPSAPSRPTRPSVQPSRPAAPAPSARPAAPSRPSQPANNGSAPGRARRD
ncbi:hypothetical protein LX64_01196 [Chitinophaga skermanii]|uniref:YXWGXW repeat-containing protein n=1 Tax=Chitinophaga skermanii TaxID=331697 RepID=A0A327QYP2_9BACT|nr:DUF6600 domain-containing protein [Chitinophaga skermanii]RAJ08543.1 hypothetical protein LX64_01196 [Chitinophaga skermanii]